MRRVRQIFSERLLFLCRKHVCVCVCVCVCEWVCEESEGNISLMKCGYLRTECRMFDQLRLRPNTEKNNLYVMFWKQPNFLCVRCGKAVSVVFAQRTTFLRLSSGWTSVGTGRSILFSISSACLPQQTDLIRVSYEARFFSFLKELFPFDVVTS